MSILSSLILFRSVSIEDKTTISSAKTKKSCRKAKGGSKFIDKIMNASQDRIKQHKVASKKRQERIAQEAKELSKFNAKMAKEGTQKLFKEVLRPESPVRPTEKPLSLYYALSANKSRNTLKVGIRMLYTLNI